MNIALVLASGKGSRVLNETTPKQFILVNEIPLLFYSVLAFERCDKIDQIVIVTSEEHIQFVKDYATKLNIKKITNVVVGGASRQESSFLGLSSLNCAKDDIVLIHDAARPLVSEDIIKNNILAAQTNGAAITAIKCNDSLITTAKTYLNRDEIYLIQTPQSFKFELIFSTHKNNQGCNATDDASLLIDTYKNIEIVNGSRNNFKVTTDEDLKYFNYLIKDFFD